MHKARKRFGQNFLQDDYVIEQIIDAINPQKDESLIEIGPGQGALTKPLFERSGHLSVVELDRDLVPFLLARFGDSEHFKLINDDVLNVNFTSIASDTNSDEVKVVGNLPYNISTPIIFHLLENDAPISDMYFMLQKEVVERICASPGNKTWGKLGIMTQYYCDVEYLLTVEAEAFDPAPKVQSAVVRMTPHKTIEQPVESLKDFRHVVGSAFNQRRKTLRNGLKNIVEIEQFEQAGVDCTQRPDVTSLQEFIKISNILTSAKNN